MRLRSIPTRPWGARWTSYRRKKFDTIYSEPIIKESLSAGWGPITYRQNTELTIDAWHWNPNGKWSDAEHKSGYFTGNGEPTEFLRQSFGYKLPHRGTTRSDAGQNEFSRMTDGDGASYWKSNPYLTEKFTGESDALHPQWVVLDFSAAQDISAMETAWANLSATRFVIEYWTGKEDAITKQNGSSWVKFPNGGVSGDRGEQATEALGKTYCGTVLAYLDEGIVE